jgi:hypothetical protein
MTSFKRMFARGGAALLCGIVCTVATAQGFYSDRTLFTFSRSVELPGGITLEPGKYVFRLVDSSANRHIVQILNEYETQIVATVQAVEASDDAVVVFGDTPANAPRPIRYWYQAGGTVDPIGYEFVYPKEQAIRIANTTNQHVLMTDGPASDAGAMARAQVRKMDPNGATAEHREGVRPQAGSTSPAAVTRERKTSVPEGASTELRKVAGVQSFTILGLTLLGVAVVAVRVHSHAHPRRLELLSALDR